jgi:hypothetical protein
MTMKDELCDYANLSHANAWRRAKIQTPPVNPDEPGFVSSLLSPDIIQGLRDILKKYTVPGTKVRTRGIFTHQTPKVVPSGASKSVEIGDLMFVHIDMPVGAPSSARALLLQAKMSLKPKTGSLASANEALQFKLYRDWLPFHGKFRLPKYSPLGGAWDFRPTPTDKLTAQLGSGYITIFDNEAYNTVYAAQQWLAPVNPGPAALNLSASFPKSTTWSLGSSPSFNTKPSDGVDCLNDFGTAFSDFLAGSSGRTFSLGANSGTDHWSAFVNFMLAEALSPGYKFKLKNQGVKSAARAANINFVSTVFQAIERLNTFGLDGDDIFEPWPESELLKALGFLEHDEGPPEELQNAETNPGGRHVPILIVLTFGNPEQPRFRNFYG